MVCTKCPRNSTQENKGQITCDVCPINQPITEKEGTVFQSDCIQSKLTFLEHYKIMRSIKPFSILDCNAGSYFNKTTLNCTKCKRNGYQPQIGKTKCFACGTNKITIETGAIDDLPCLRFGQVLLDNTRNNG